MIGSWRIRGAATSTARYIVDRTDSMHSLCESHEVVGINNLEFAGIENFNNYEAYKEALEGGLRLTMRYLKFLFFGPPRSGKSSTRRWLIAEIVNLHQLGGLSVSTGVAETNDVIIKKLTCEPAAIAGSQWQSMQKSNEATPSGIYDEENFSYLARLFYQLIRRNPTPSTSDESVPLQSHTSTDDFPSDGLPNDENRTHEHICLPITPGSTAGLTEGLEITDSEEVKIKNEIDSKIN